MNEGTVSTTTDQKLNSHTEEKYSSSGVPSVFDYLDFKLFLTDFYKQKKATSTTFSLAVFANRAGLQTRNYLKRVMDGERPLSVDKIPKFCKGLGLEAREKIYFEALVHFNQARDDEAKRHYFGALRQASLGIPSSAIDLVEAQFEVFSHWYIVPIREMVLLKDFREDPGYIATKLKDKISKKEAQNGLDVLIKLGLLVRDESTGKLKQANPVMRYSADVINMVVREFHHQTLDRTKAAINEDKFESWNVRSLSIPIPRSEMSNVHKAVNDFISELNMKLTAAFGEPDAKTGPQCETVLQVNMQVIELTKE
jgi:uncharacterized protein (TIGR02147 family)